MNRAIRGFVAILGTLALPCEVWGQQQPPLPKRPGPPQSAEVDAAVGHACAWLVAHQQADGSWEKGSGPVANRPGMSRLRAGPTGLAVLALLSESKQPFEGRYKASLNKGLEFLLSQVHDQAAADLAGDGGSMVWHSLALQGLLEAGIHSKDPRYQKAAQAAVAFAISQQNGRDGGWGIEKGKESQMQVSVWPLGALKEAGLNSLEVPRRPIALSIAFVNSASLELGKSYADTLPPQEAHPRASAAGHWMRLLTGWSPHHPSLVSALDGLTQKGPNDQDPQLNYFATQAIFLTGGDRWDVWNRALRVHLLKTQVAKGTYDDQRGSWSSIPPQERLEGARILETGLAVLMLRAHERYLANYPETTDLAADAWVEWIRQVRLAPPLSLPAPYKPGQGGWNLERRPVAHSETYFKARGNKAWFRGLGTRVGVLYRPAAISNNGEWVVGHAYAVESRQYQAAAWALIDDVELHLLTGPTNSVFWKMAADGSLFAGQIEDVHGFYWTRKGGVKEIGTLPGLPPTRGATASNRIQYVSPDGKVMAGMSSSADGLQPYRWTAQEGMTGLGAEYSTEGLLGGNADGELLIGWAQGANRELFCWTRAEGIKPLKIPLKFGKIGVPYGGAGISQDGKIFFSGRKDYFTYLGARWTADSEAVAIGHVDDTSYYGVPCAMSADGRRIVGVRTKFEATPSYLSFVWDEKQGTRLLPQILEGLEILPPRWQHLRITNLSSDGIHLTGTGVNPKGDEEAWVAMIPRE